MASEEPTLLGCSRADLGGADGKYRVSEHLRTLRAAGRPYAWLTRNAMLSFGGTRTALAHEAEGVARAGASVVGASDGELFTQASAHLCSLAEVVARQAERGLQSTIVCAGESGSGKSDAASRLVLHLMKRVQPPVDDHHARIHRALSLALPLACLVVDALSTASGPACRHASRAVRQTKVALRSGPSAGLLCAAHIQGALPRLHRAATPPTPCHANFQLLLAAAFSASSKELAGLSPAELRLVRAAVPSPDDATFQFEATGSSLRALGMDGETIEQEMASSPKPQQWA